MDIIKQHAGKPLTLNNNFPTIGLLTEGLDGEYQAAVWPGIADAARENQVNLICFCGGSLRVSSLDPWDSQGNVLYKIAEKNNLDGCIIAGSLGSYVSEAVLDEFLKHFAHLKAVTLAPATESIPAVFVDNRSGMRSLVTHLVEDHRFRKIAFVRGPAGNLEAEERLRFFKDVLKEHEIPLDQNLLLPGDFTRLCGISAVNRLLASKTDFEVLVAADDETALGALQALQEHGKKVPEDVAVVGFDDIEECSYVTPPLTTVSQPYYDLGKTAVDLLLRSLRGEAIPQKTILQAKLTIRQSCGCFRCCPDIAETGRAVPLRFSTQPVLVEKDVAEYCMPSVDPLYADNARSVLSFFCDDVNNRTVVSFLKMIDRLGREMIVQDKNLSVWHNLLFSMRNYAASHCDNASFAFADDLLHQAFIICGDVKQSDQGMRRIVTVRNNYFLHEIGDVIRNTHDFHKLLDALCVCLPKLGMHTFYLSLYEPGKKIPGTLSRLVCAFIDNKRKKLAENGIVFETCDCVPEGIVPGNRLHILVAEPLYFQKEQFGTILFEADQQESRCFSILKEYISGALYSSALIKKIQHQAEVLEYANAELEKLREKEHAYLQAIKRELELGRKIQMGFLPESLPLLAGWEISAAFIPAREVSGDFYDAFLLGEDRVALVIADVSGKDVSAALFMSLIRTIIRVFSERAQVHGDDPLDSIKVVNDYILRHHHLEDGRHSMFATIFFGLLKPSTGELHYVNAGHNAPNIISANAAVHELPRTGLAVGLANDCAFERKKITIKKGEMLFAYTDGVTEAKTPSGEFFTRKRLVHLLEKESSSAAEKVAQVKFALDAHNGGAPPFDDITILALRRK